MPAQIVSHTRHPLVVDMCDAAFSPPAARTVLAALHLAGPRLRGVCLRGTWLGRSAVKALLQDGLPCTGLDLSACRNLRGKLAMGPSFGALTTLVLDANPGIQNLTQVSTQPHALRTGPDGCQAPKLGARSFHAMHPHFNFMMAELTCLIRTPSLLRDLPRWPACWHSSLGQLVLLC